jgi:hypothetical protein
MRRLRLATVAVASFCIVAMAATSAFALNAPGNDGTVKIDKLPFDMHPNNEPHVGCVFQVDLYNFGNGGLTGVASFSLQSPTLSAGPSQLLEVDSTTLADISNPGADTDGYQGDITVDLSSALAASGATAHPIQGFHVKLTVEVKDNVGNDSFNKYKVFWVQGCEAPPPPV